MSSPYLHQLLENPSDEIRLIRVLPGCRSDPIACTLEVVQRKTNPRYGAVSYTWGDTRLQNIIYVNGQPLVVRYNCFFALWQLRLLNFDLPIWIDSICIDQSNNHEKSKQVRLMGLIYARAELTMACIGEGLQLRAVASDIASADLSDIHQAWHAWRNMSLLAKNGYFKRLWIVQELYHSKSIAILCGEDNLLWDDLQPFFLELAEATSKYASHLEASSEWPDLDTTELARFIHFRKFRWAQLAFKTEWTDEITGHGFTGIILSFGESACADPRDKIYGLLSLAQDRRWLVDFPVDYNRPLIDVLRDVVSRIANESLAENTSRLIANMLRWFDIVPASVAGRTLLQSTDCGNTGPLVPWSNFPYNVIPFESARVWQVRNLPMSSNAFVPHTRNLLVYFNGVSVPRESQYARLNWHHICNARGTIIKSSSENFWIAGPEVRPGDFIVEFNAMRDEQDEHSTVVICRPPNRKSSRLDIVDQATALISLEDYDTIYDTDFHRSYPSEGLSKLEVQYLTSRMLFAWPCEDRMVVNLRPFDLINAVMTRGHIINRVRYPILSRNSGCYTIKVEVDKAEVQSRTYTITVHPEVVDN